MSLRAFPPDFPADHPEPSEGSDLLGQLVEALIEFTSDEPNTGEEA